MMELINAVGFLVATVVGMLCGDRLRQVNWGTHKARYVATPLLFLLWSIFFAADAAAARIEPYQIFAGLAAVSWLASTHKTWAAGPPQYTERAHPLKAEHFHHVNGGKR